MPAQKMPTILLGLACVAIVLVTFIVGYVLMRDTGGTVAPPAAGGAAVTTAPAVAVAIETPRPTVVVPPSAKVAPAPAHTVPPTANPTTMPAAVEITEWNPSHQGCDVEVTGTKIHIFGTNDADGLGHENCVNGSTEYPVQDFEIATDFMVPKFNGSGTATVILRPRESNFSQVTLQYDVKARSYMMFWWDHSGYAYSRTRLPAFGDEATAFHRMRLKYEAATHTSTGWIDDKKVGTIDFEFKSDVRFVVGAATDQKGNDIDLYFDHTTLSLGGNTVVAGEAEVAP